MPLYIQLAMFQVLTSKSQKMRQFIHVYSLNNAIPESFHISFKRRRSRDFFLENFHSKSLLAWNVKDTNTSTLSYTQKII